MKINKLWIPMIIFGIIGGAAKLCDTVFNVNGIGFFVDSGVCSAIFIISIVLVWLIGVILLVVDRKVDVTLTPPKSKVTGFFGFIAAVSLLGTGVLSLFSLGSSDSFIGSLIMCLITLAAGGILLYESCISFTGHNGMKRIPMAALLLPAWGCGRLITLFIEYSKVSIHATEMFDVLSVPFLMLFLFYQAMLFAEIGPRAAVRRSTLYGICYIMCGLITTADIIVKMVSPTPEITVVDVLVVEPTVGRILTCVGDLAFVLYAASFVISNSRNAVILRYEPDDDEDDDPEFLGHISAEKTPKKKNDDKKQPSSKKKGGSSTKGKEKGTKQTADKQPVSFISSNLKLEEYDDEPLDFSDIRKAKQDIQGSDTSKDDKNALSDVSDEKTEAADENETEMLSFDNITDIRPAPMTYESVISSEPEPEESEPEPQEEEAEIPSYTETYNGGRSGEDEEEEDFTEEDIFGDGEDEDYDEIFRLLDEMDTGD